MAGGWSYGGHILLNAISWDQFKFGTDPVKPGPKNGVDSDSSLVVKGCCDLLNKLFIRTKKSYTNYDFIFRFYTNCGDCLDRLCCQVEHVYKESMFQNSHLCSNIHIKKNGSLLSLILSCRGWSLHQVNKLSVSTYVISDMESDSLVFSIKL